MVFLWMGVGKRYPFRFMPRRTGMLSPIASAGGRIVCQRLQPGMDSEALTGALSSLSPERCP